MTTTTQTKGKKSCVLDIATTDVVSVPPTMNIIEGLSKMSTHNFRRLPLTDAGTKKLLGIVTVTDVIDLMGGGNLMMPVENQDDEKIPIKDNNVKKGLKNQQKKLLENKEKKHSNKLLKIKKL